MDFKLQVECYSGYRGEETPRRFLSGGQWVNVRQILDRWIAPDHRYFKVLGDDDATYILRHDSWGDAWVLTFFKSSSSPESD